MHSPLLFYYVDCSMKRSIYCAYFLLLTLSAAAQKTTLQYSIAPWLNNKKAAASITLDDAINCQFTIAAPLLKKYDIKATFFITAVIMKQQAITWNMVRAAAANGNEIANHTITHPYLRRMSPDSMIYQVDACNKLIRDSIPSQKSETMAYPFGDGGYETDSEALVRKTITPYCIGARATRNNKLAYNTYNFAAGNNDAYYKVNCDVIADTATMAGLPAQLDATITAGGWYVPLYHGIETGWLITPASVFEKHLQEFAKRKNDLWITTFAEALKYHKERNCATLHYSGENKSLLALALIDTLKNTSVWNEPLTINMKKPGGWKVKSISQGTTQIPFSDEGDTIVFNALPGMEDIVIRKN